jgi:hypothetical protein
MYGKVRSTFYPNNYPRVSVIVEALENVEMLSITVACEHIGSLLYVDDIALIANDARSITQMLEAVYQLSLTMDFPFNVLKCKVLAPYSSPS